MRVSARIFNPRYSRRFVVKSLDRVARRAPGAARTRGVLEQYVEGLNGEAARLAADEAWPGLSQQRGGDWSRSGRE
jgi:hypothetical protein